MGSLPEVFFRPHRVPNWLRLPRIATGGRGSYHAGVSTPNVSHDRGIYPVEVVANVEPCREHFRLTFRATNFPTADPGQFVQVLCRSDATGESAQGRPRLVEWRPGGRVGDPSDDFVARHALLRRPFSIAGLRRAGATAEIDVIGRDIGPGTHYLATLRSGARTELLGPLGRPFELVPSESCSILVAGGVGLPPLMWLAERIAGSGGRCIAVVGARTADLIPLEWRDMPAADGTANRCAVAFARLGIATIVTTDDGTRGLRGTTVDGLRRCLTALGKAARDAAVYSCGPERMMQAVAAECAASRVRCQVCMERVMACGMGTCQSCVVRVRDESSRGWRFELCCSQGPVFDATRIVW